MLQYPSSVLVVEFFFAIYCLFILSNYFLPFIWKTNKLWFCLYFMTGVGCGCKTLTLLLQSSFMNNNGCKFTFQALNFVIYSPGKATFFERHIGKLWKGHQKCPRPNWLLRGALRPVKGASAVAFDVVHVEELGREELWWCWSVFIISH